MTESAVDVIIFCAMSNEVVAVNLASQPPFEQVVCGRTRASIGTQDGLRCLTMASGFGEKRVARCFREVTEAYRPRLLINFGAAGAIRPGLEIGTSTIPQEVVAYSWPDLAPNGDPIAIPVEALRSVHHGLEITRAGSCLHDIRDEAIRARLAAELQIDTTDCETWQIASLCREARIPFLALRCITDHAGSTAGYEYGRNARNVLDRGARLLAPLAVRMLESLPIDENSDLA